MVRALCVAVALMITACAAESEPQTIADFELKQATLERSQHPVGRYQYIGKERFTDSTEYYCMDTATGDIGVASVPDDPAKVKADSFTCK